MPFVYQFVNIKRDVVTLAESINQGLVFVDRVLVVELAAIPSLAGGLIPSPPGDCARPGGLRIPSLLAGGALAEMNRCAGSTPFFCVCPPVCKLACSGREQTQKNRKIFIFRFFSAEREGFEPPDPLRSTVFKTAAIDHSATSPNPPRLLWDCKGRNYFCFSKFIFKKFDFFC